MASLDPDRLTVRRVGDVAAGEVVAALNHCFQGYVAPTRFTLEQYESHFRAEHLDPLASRLYVLGERPAAVVLVARRGWSARIAAMAVAPECRRAGVGRRAMAEAVEDARARGDRTVRLEVIEQNAPAVGLYRALGFRARRRLVGYRRPAGAPPGPRSPARLAELDPAELARVVAREAEPDLPWQLAPETLAAETAPARAFHLERRAFALVADPGAETLNLRALVVPRADRGQRWGARMLAALAAEHAGRPWAVTPIVPETLADGFFLGQGWRRHELAQLEMELPLPASAPPVGHNQGAS